MQGRQVAISTSEGLLLPSLIAEAGERASWRFLEFFTINIRNPQTRAAHSRAAGEILHWCESRGITQLHDVKPMHGGGYIEQLGKERSGPTVKQDLACLRMLFYWLATGQVVPSNPAHAVRGRRHSVGKGATRVITSGGATALLVGMDISSLVGLRDPAITAVMTYTFARVGAVVALAVEDHFPQKKHWWLKLHEKNGKVNEMPCHPKLAQYLNDYLESAGIAKERNEPLFRSVKGKTKTLSPLPLSRSDVWAMIRRRAKDAGTGCHTFRPTGITDYSSNGGKLEVAQGMAGHSNAKTTGLYDRRSGDISLSEVVRIGI